MAAYTLSFELAYNTFTDVMADWCTVRLIWMRATPLSDFSKNIMKNCRDIITNFFRK